MILLLAQPAKPLVESSSLQGRPQPSPAHVSPKPDQIRPDLSQKPKKPSSTANLQPPRCQQTHFKRAS
ncbi:hypothetical protein Q7C36_008262 [Tachysurus vachellii]|uniref:Uncharacterized protein n=1 Tax=Tachysurus vachellii TaxID=175792 RepID=A0AA88NAA5_TACVA|nr:hypothetical protein Q7C36_008262 [Tachysurus vachellii]